VAEERHGIEVGIDSTGAKPGEDRVIRSLENIKRKTKEVNDASAASGTAGARGFEKMAASGKTAERSLDGIRAKARQTGQDNERAANRSGSAWQRAFAAMRGGGFGGGGGGGGGGGPDGLGASFRAAANSANLFGTSMSGANAIGLVLGRTIGFLTGALTAFVSVQGVLAFLKLTDAAKQMEAQLRLTIPATTSLAQAHEQVNRIALTTRSGLEPVTELYGRIARQATELGYSSESAARATETVTKALKISGASGAETASVIRQLTQAMASGTLRGDEFNAIMENSPRLAKLLADSMGVAVGSLRAMAEEGEISSAKLYKAMTDKRFTARLDEEFRQIPVTFDDAMTLVHNAALTTFSAFDRGGQFSQMFVNFMMDITGGFSNSGDAAEEFGMRVRASFDGMVAGVKELIDWIGRIGGEMGILGDIIEKIGSMLSFAFSGNQIQGLLKALDDVINSFIDIINHIRTLKNYLPGTDAEMLEHVNMAGAGAAAATESQRYLETAKADRDWKAFLPRGWNFQGPEDLKQYVKTGSAVPPHMAPTAANDNKAEKARSAAQALNDFIRELNAEGLTTLANPVRTAKRQNELFQQGLTPLSGYGPGEISAHQASRAVDLDRGAFDAQTTQKIYAAAQRAGIKGVEMVSESGNRRHLEFEGHTKPGDLTDMLRDQKKAQEDLAKLAERRVAAENDFWATLQNEAKVAGMLPGEAQKYSKQLELQKILADGVLSAVKPLTDEQIKQVNNAVDLINKNKIIASIELGKKDALIEQTHLLDQQQALQGMNAEQVEEQMALEERLWPYKKKMLEDGLNLQDETVKKALEELRAREKTNYEIERRNRLIQEGNAQVDSLVERSLSPEYRADAEFSAAKQQIFNSSRSQDQKDKALEQLTKEYAAQMKEIQDAFYEKMMGSIHKIARALGGAFGDLVESIGTLAVIFSKMSQELYKAGDVGRSSNNPVSQVASGLQDMTKSLGSLFGKNGQMSQTMGQIATGLGAVADGAAIGEQVAVSMKALGWKKFSTLGAEIGGGVGSAIGMYFGGPAGAKIGGFIGGFIGGAIGSLFKKTKFASATITDAYGKPDVTGKSEGGKYDTAATAMAKAVQGTLIQIANALGAQLGTFAVSIGMYKGKFIVDESGTGKVKGPGTPSFKTEEEAIAYAILNAIQDGALKGLSAATERILKGATLGNLDQLLQAAQIYETLFKAAQAAANPMAAAYASFVQGMQATMAQLKAAGYTYNELALLADAYAAQQKQILEEMTAGYRDFLNEITNGASSGKTIYDQFLAAQASFQALIASGDYTQDEFTNAGQTYLDLAGKVYGTATPQFEAIRAELIAATQKAIDDATKAAQDALNSAGIIAAIGDTNSILTAILNALYGTNGAPAPGTGTTPGSVGGGATGTPTYGDGSGTGAPITNPMAAPGTVLQ